MELCPQPTLVRIEPQATSSSRLLSRTAIRRRRTSSISTSVVTQVTILDAASLSARRRLYRCVSTLRVRGEVRPYSYNRRVVRQTEQARPWTVAFYLAHTRERRRRVGAEELVLTCERVDQQPVPWVVVILQAHIERRHRERAGRRVA